MPWSRAARVGAVVAQLVAAYLVVAVLAWAFQGRLLYVGQGRAPKAVPAGVRLATYEASDGVAVHALELDKRGASQTVVYFHGNGEVAGEELWLARELGRRGFSVVLAEYRGYGQSQPGDPTEAGLYADAEATLRGLAARGVDAAHVVLWGWSLGTGVAAEMASRGEGGALVLVSPYASMREAAAAHYPWLPVALLLRDRFATAQKGPSIHVPTVVVHGTDDGSIPFEQGKRVAESIAGSVFLAVEGGHHADLFAGPRASLFDDIARTVRRPPGRSAQSEEREEREDERGR